MALFAFARHKNVGVDIEKIRVDVDYRSIATQFFHPQEVNALLSQPSERQMEGFYRTWASKEAYVKATALGLSLPLRDFQVTATPGQLAIQNEEQWSLFEVFPATGYVGVLAVQGPATLILYDATFPTH